jgi:hypothetical protein
MCDSSLRLAETAALWRQRCPLRHVCYSSLFLQSYRTSSFQQLTIWGCGNAQDRTHDARALGIGLDHLIAEGFDRRSGLPLLLSILDQQHVQEQRPFLLGMRR